MDHGIHGLDTCFQYPNLGLRFGWGPFPHLVWECRRCFHGDRVCHTATKSQALSLHYLNGYALKMFELGKISSGKAAELAGMSRVEFFEACGRYRVSIFNYPDDEIEAELAADLATINKILEP